MAKVLNGASLVVKHDAASNLPVLYVQLELLVPAAEYAATIALAGLTNSIPAAAHADVARQIAAGASG